MSAPLKSVLAVLAVAFVSTSCAGGGSSSTTPSLLPGTQQVPFASGRQIAESQHDDHPAAAYTLFGDAVLVHPGHNSHTAAQARWAGATAPYGGVDFSVPAGMTLSQLLNLSTDYKFTVGTCGGGSPRFSVFVSNGTASGNVNFYIGPPPNYTGCPPNVWANSGNLATPTNLVDDSQLPGGTFYDPYASAELKYGSYKVQSIIVVVDGFGGPSSYQTVQFDNVRINQKLYTFERGNGENGDDNNGDDGDHDHHGDDGDHGDHG